MDTSDVNKANPTKAKARRAKAKAGTFKDKAKA
jgi:hypothetical protein